MSDNRARDQAKAQYVYVTMTDNFMSGWGHAKGKVNKLVISCNDMAEAETVGANARRRSEMRYVNIAMNRPRYDPDRYHVSWHGREQGDYNAWFECDAFPRA